MKTSIVYSNQWNDLVFEGRNKMYGAYQLRIQSDNNTIKGFLMALLFIASGILIPFLTREIFLKITPPQTYASTPVVLSDYKRDEIVRKTEILQPVESRHHASNTDMIVKPLISDNKDADDDKAKNTLLSHNDVTSIGDSADTSDTGNPFVSDLHSGIPEDTAVYSTAGIEQLPEFPGGENALLSYIGSHTKYPQDMIDANVDGIVYMSFVVDKSGRINSVDVMRGIGASKKFENEAARVIRTMPEWKPGKQNGHAVNVLFMLPIRFALK